MKKTSMAIAGLLVLAFAIAPVATADHVDDSDAGAQGLYVIAGEDGIEVWEETNDHSGLQTEATDTDGDGEDDLEPDSQIL